ncbi:MAG TPA: SRPBCC family protein [Sedimentisphaerales bacterium]|jgi:carbon monoxide dehydrogenase subunit G|nr:SRPBCC family protein [Sedimentisphaerales bacterium]HNU30849.1 SRPBCC family protein [Sedimentisphaerales bacterium]
MIRSESSIEIDVPVETVFAHLSDPMNMVEDLPSAVEVKDIKGQGQGMTYTLIYKVLGVRLSMPCEVTEYVPQRRITIRSEKMTFAHGFEPTEKGCRLSGFCEYEIPIPLIGKIAESLLKKMNEREWKAVEENLKAKLEARATAAVD